MHMSNIHSAWKIPWTEEPGRLQSMGSRESDTTERLHFPFSLSCIGEGNGNPLQRSCLENPRDGGAWWAAISGVAQSRTWLKRLSSSSSNIHSAVLKPSHTEINDAAVVCCLVTKSSSFPTPGDLPNPGTEPLSLISPALADGFFTTAPPSTILQ